MDANPHRPRLPSMNQTISSAIQWWAANTPENTAVVIAGDRFTYLELHDWANWLAAKLLEQGVRAQDRVAVCAGNSIEFCAVMLGTMRVSGIVAPISTRLTAFEIGEILGELEPAVVYADDANLPKFASHKVSAAS